MILLKHLSILKVHKFFYENEIPTLYKVCEQLSQFSTLKSTIFTRVRVSQDKEVECNHQQRQYLKSVHQYRSQNQKFYYFDEIWENKGHGMNVWIDSTV
jgi:hypothetical protein